MALPFVQSLADGVFVIDTGFHRPMFDAAFLLVEHGRAAFIDTGTNFAVPRLLATLTDLGLAPAAVDYVIPTHVHLDHAGGAGLLMQSLPNATLLVHPRGARHMIDPQALYKGCVGGLRASRDGQRLRQPCGSARRAGAGYRRWHDCGSGGPPAAVH